ncbi:potassium channel family protein [Halovenus rubra]|uniref:Potassium channel family protein n=2 Tax=Halovenus rubra TaxID=869890 RepID=A0ABD5XCW0_9EURY|nr:TrkA family potassium uptake protein [Halovenus rubra]
MYLIIVGAGDIGGPLIETATRSGNDVVVVENDSQRADEIASEYDCLVLNDDATTKDVLEDAGADQADAIISTTAKDATNVMISLLAKELEIPSVVAVVHNPEHMALYEQIGVHTMENPQQLIADYLYRSVARPAIVDYMKIGEEAEVFEITVTESAPVVGKTLQEAANEHLIPEDVLIVAIERGGQDPPITPRGNIEIAAGDLLTVYSGFGADPELTDLFGHVEDDPQ